jgi:DNA repair exonuclease SbcCD nuclease subunit
MRKHLGIDGDTSGREMLEHFDLVLLGHHHVHDIITEEKSFRKVVSIGSPLQHTFGDRGEQKGFVVIDTGTLDVEFHELRTPRFTAFEGAKAIIPEEVEGGFVRVKVESKAEAAKAKKVLEKAGAASVVIEIIPKAKESRIDLTPGAKDTEILSKYVESEWGETNLDSKRLLQKGRKYLSG